MTQYSEHFWLSVCNVSLFLHNKFIHLYLKSYFVQYGGFLGLTHDIIDQNVNDDSFRVNNEIKLKAK